MNEDWEKELNENLVNWLNDNAPLTDIRNFVTKTLRAQRQEVIRRIESFYHSDDFSVATKDMGIAIKDLLADLREGNV